MTKRLLLAAALAIAFAGCGTITGSTETRITTEPFGPTLNTNQTTPTPSSSTTVVLDKPKGGERWLCRDEEDWRQPERVHLVAIRLGDLNREARMALESTEGVERAELGAQIIARNIETLESVTEGELNPEERLIFGVLMLGEEMGAISVAGETYIATYGVEGINRRWNWNPNPDEGFDDALILEPSGIASYVDFRDAEGSPGTRSAKAKRFFQCKQG